MAENDVINEYLASTIRKWEQIYQEQRQRIDDLEQQNTALQEALEGMLFIFGHNDGYVQVKNAKQAMKECKP